MPVDQATADYAEEQEKRAYLQDSHAMEQALSQVTRPEPIPEKLPVCAQCINWQPARKLYRADGSTAISPGFCSLRASAELEQMSQDYASQCRFFVEEIPL